MPRQERRKLPVIPERKLVTEGPVTLQKSRSPGLTPHKPENQSLAVQPSSQTPSGFNSPVHISSPIQDTRSSFGSLQEFYTPQRSRRAEERVLEMEDSLSPVELEESNTTLAYSPAEQSTPVASGRRVLRSRAQIRKPDYYRPVSSLGVQLNDSRNRDMATPGRRWNPLSMREIKQLRQTLSLEPHISWV